MESKGHVVAARGEQGVSLLSAKAVLECDKILACEELMTTITLPPEVEGPLAEEARRKGTTPELLAVDCLRKLFSPSPHLPTPEEGETLFDFLVGYVGTVSGTTEPLSEHCGQRFAQGLIEKQQRGHV